MQQLVANFEPMNDYMDEARNHRKFVELTEDEVDEKLKPIR
jgi:hypothetical protein